MDKLKQTLIVLVAAINPQLHLLKVIKKEVKNIRFVKMLSVIDETQRLLVKVNSSNFWKRFC